MTPPPLVRRDTDRERLAASVVDVAVVGGGVNGAGIALDAVSRGLSTVVLERDDLAVGTSSRSSKLIHGGLRYLEQYRFGLVREALGERQLLTALAPHIVAMERFVVPVKGSRWEVPYIGAGLAIYDALGGRHGGRFRFRSPAAARAGTPALRSERMRGAFEYSDGVFDDARLVVALAGTARSLGATIITRAEVTGKERSREGITRLTVRDHLDGGPWQIAARTVVDATGAFTAGADTGLVPSRGVHLVVPRDRIPVKAGLTIRVPGRVVFLIPWLGHWLVGTTDNVHDGPVDRPRAYAPEVSYLLDSVRSVLDLDLTETDVIATFAGVRPLAGGGGPGGDTARLSREERIDEPSAGTFTVRGGKYTTYRVVAARVVDRVVDRLGRGGPSTTSTLPLVGAAPAPVLEATTQALIDSGLEPAVADRLVARHGHRAARVAETARALDMTGPLIPGLPYLEVESWWAVHHEGALSIDDVLARRTRVALEDSAHGASAAASVAGVVGAALGWTAEERAAAPDEYVAVSAREYGVPRNDRYLTEASP